MGTGRHLIADSRARRSVARGAMLLAAFALAGSAIGANASATAVDEQTRAALALAPQPRDGAILFRRSCATCHGKAAQGDPAKAIPSLAGQRFAYLVRQLAGLAGDQRESATMHAVLAARGLHEPQAWVDIASFLSSAPPLQHARAGDGTALKLGEAIFREQCASCHRDDARGDDDGFVPSLRGQHFGYLLAQIRSLGASRRHNVDERLVQFLRSLEVDESEAVADYLSRLPPPSGDRGPRGRP